MSNRESGKADILEGTLDLMVLQTLAATPRWFAEVVRAAITHVPDVPNKVSEPKSLQ